MFSPKNILVPTDFSEASDRALNQALDIAEQFHSRIYLLHVITESLQRCGEDYCLDESIIKIETTWGTRHCPLPSILCMLPVTTYSLTRST